MALVMLPSDLPWWDSVKKQLKKISETKNTVEIVQAMQKIYEMCNVSLDPEDDTIDPEQFVGFLDFLETEMSCEERSNFLNQTLPNIVKRALMIKELRPRRGVHFSLQQQTDVNEFDYSFAASLLANAFFSTFPKRTHKSHPTLQNFNFASFFKTIQTSNAQKAKLRSVLHYFDWLEKGDNAKGSLRVLRQVMHSKEWLTIDDWLECSLQLCPLQIKHDGQLNRSEAQNLQICFSSSKLGGEVLGTGCTQESISFATIPEMLTVLLNVEALEDNEVITVERVRHVARIADPKHKAKFEKLDNARDVTVCCIDADDYTKLPIGQYEEDNILRELNKCLLGFQQKKTSSSDSLDDPNTTSYTYSYRHRRLSPIGESIGSNQSDGNNVPLITQQSCSTTRTDSLISENSGNNNTTNMLKVRLQVEKNPQRKGTVDESVVNNRRGRFIVLGSSGECLPVTRYPLKVQKSLSSASSSEDDFHSAKSSLDDGSEDDNYHKRYSIDLETAERRHTFAQRLREALKKEDAAGHSTSSSEEASYAVGISVAGSGVRDCDIKVKRGGSTGFALKEDSLGEEFLEISLNKERQWIDRFKTKQTALSKKESNKSSEYSFSTEYSSELEEVYEQFSHWLENPILETDKGNKKELDARDLAVVRFAGSLLKRTLSESFAGVPVPLTEACDSTSDNMINYSTKKHKIVLSAKSLSLELARQKHRLAAQLSLDCRSTNRKNETNALDETNPITNNSRKAWFISCVTEAIIQTLEDIDFTACLPLDQQVSAIARTSANGSRAVTTGNWGCGSSRKGDVQLKVVIQWMAASVAGIPSLVYYTHKHQQLAKLDTVCRILIDRKWTVKDLAEATLRYSNHVLRGKELSGTLFEELIGMDRSIIT
ncbi:uncharacterized protein LOC109538689 isoform X2 [Dendroctonus ponderosae]|uniref:uncharacterized protein LOC109538689 isoform X2 n=1 Tax=Dendroctonus ponderosae TaxID=77166 RepID=UPI00203634D4|nr:uncharacterized protein LOC109538689 isoform X2 [Dendroctonus ponderosae]